MGSVGLRDDIRVHEDIIIPEYVKVTDIRCFPILCSGLLCYKNNPQYPTSMKIKKVNTEIGFCAELAIFGQYRSELVKLPNEWKSWISINIPFSEIDSLIHQLQKIKDNEQQVHLKF